MKILKINGNEDKVLSEEIEYMPQFYEDTEPIYIKYKIGLVSKSKLFYPIYYSGTGISKSQACCRCSIFKLNNNKASEDFCNTNVCYRNKMYLTIDLPNELAYINQVKIPKIANMIESRLDTILTKSVCNVNSCIYYEECNHKDVEKNDHPLCLLNKIKSVSLSELFFLKCDIKDLLSMKDL